MSFDEEHEKRIELVIRVEDAEKIARMAMRCDGENISYRWWE
jgi:hypothetical protein